MQGARSVGDEVDVREDQQLRQGEQSANDRGHPRPRLRGPCGKGGNRPVHEVLLTPDASEVKAAAPNAESGYGATVTATAAEVTPWNTAVIEVAPPARAVSSPRDPLALETVAMVAVDESHVDTAVRSRMARSL